MVLPVVATKKTRTWIVRLGEGYEVEGGEYIEDSPTEILQKGWTYQGYEDEIFISIFVPDTRDSNELDN